MPFEVLEWKDKEGLDAFIKKERQEGFDLTKAPLFKVTLIKHSSYTMIWSQHHILTDGWSTPLILTDVFKAYEALKEGRNISLKSRPLYQTYIAWLQTQNKKKAEHFWRNYLSSIEGPTFLRFKGEEQDKDYDTFSLAFSEAETDALNRFAQERNLTLNTLLQGALGIVLKHYTQQEEVVIGVTVSGRNIPLPGIEEMVGIFINTLPLKISFTNKGSTLAFLRTLQEDAQEINEYAYTPLAEIQSWTNASESLFDVLFVFENYPTRRRSTQLPP